MTFHEGYIWPVVTSQEDMLAPRPLPPSDLLPRLCSPPAESTQKLEGMRSLWKSYCSAFPPRAESGSDKGQERIGKTEDKTLGEKNQ